MSFFVAIALLAVSAIVLIWLGYPVANWCVARVVGRPNVPDAKLAATRRVSVVLATRDSAELIAARVADLFATSHPRELLEVIIALDADGAKSTPEQLTELDERVRVVIGDSPGGKASALNAGVRAASGDVLVMADVAQRFDSSTIPELVSALEDARFGAVSGALELGRDGGVSPVDLYWRLEKWLRYHESLIHSSVGVTGAVYAMRRALWSDLPAGTLLDDVYVPMSVVMKGHRVAFSYAATARDVRTFNAEAEGVRKTRTLTGVMQLLQLLPEIKSSKNPIRVQFMMHKLARLTTPFWLALLVIAGCTSLALTAVRFPQLFFSVVTCLLVALAIMPPLRRKSLALARWGISMQFAMVKALANGLKGRWSVWSR